MDCARQRQEVLKKEAMLRHPNVVADIQRIIARAEQDIETAEARKRYARAQERELLNQVRDELDGHDS